MGKIKLIYNSYLFIIIIVKYELQMFDYSDVFMKYGVFALTMGTSSNNA